LRRWEEAVEEGLLAERRRRRRWRERSAERRMRQRESRERSRAWSTGNRCGGGVRWVGVTRVEILAGKVDEVGAGGGGGGEAAGKKG
jgi:hypothetical protein